MKKIVITVLVLLFSLTMVWSVNAEQNSFLDFEHNVKIGSIKDGNNVAANPSGVVSVEDTDEEGYKKVIKLVNDENYQTDAGIAFAAINSEKIAVSYDICPMQTDQEIKMIFNLSWLFDVSAENTAYGLSLAQNGKIKYSDNGNYDAYVNTDKEYFANEWMHIDAFCTFNDKEWKIAYYINGELLGETTALSENRMVNKTVYGLAFEMRKEEGPGDGNGSVLIDNVSISNAENGFVINATKGNGYVDIVFSESIKNIENISVVSIESVNGETAVNTGNIEIFGFNKLRVYYDGEITEGEEYRITLSDGIESISGNKPMSSSCYFLQEKASEKILFASDGNENVPIPIVYLNNTVTENGGNYAFYDEYNGEAALVIKGDSEKCVDVAFLPNEPTSGKIIKLSYEITAAQTHQAFSQMCNTWFAGTNDSDNAMAPAYGIMLDHQTSFAISNNSHGPWSGTGTTKWPQYSANDKNFVEVIYDFENRTVTTNLSNSKNQSFSLSGIMHTEILKSNSIKSIILRVNNGTLPGTNVSTGANPGNAVFYIQNIKLSDMTPENYIKSIRPVKCDEAIIYPDKVITPETGKFNIEFSSEIDEALLADAVTLSWEDGSETLEFLKKENSVYTFEIPDGALKAGCDYTLTVSTNLDSDYIYSFKTDKGKFRVSSLNIIKEDGTAKVDFKIVNTLNMKKKAVVTVSVLSGNKMTHFDCAVADLSKKRLFADTMEFTVNEEDVINAYVFDSLDTLNLLYDIKTIK